MNTVLAFDIETVPDVDSGARLDGLDGLSEEDIARAMTAKRVQQNGSDFLPLHLQRVAAISAVLRSGENSFRVWSLGEEGAPEAELIARFYDGVERYTPVLVSWNGGNFDLPVLHYRALLHAIPAARYWDVGDRNRDFRFNNYLNRFHWRHIDLMDVLAGFSPRAAAPLDEIAVMLGLPGKRGMSGGDVWRAHLDGKTRQIREYCECDALNTFLMYLRFELLRGNLDKDALARECGLVKTYLRESGRKHFLEFLEAWENGER